MKHFLTKTPFSGIGKTRMLFLPVLYSTGPLWMQQRGYLFLKELAWFHTAPEGFIYPLPVSENANFCVVSSPSLPLFAALPQSFLAKFSGKLHNRAIFTWGQWSVPIVTNLFVPLVPVCKFDLLLPQSFQCFGAIKESCYFQKLETCPFLPFSFLKCLFLGKTLFQILRSEWQSLSSELEIPG